MPRSERVLPRCAPLADGDRKLSSYEVHLPYPARRRNSRQHGESRTLRTRRPPGRTSHPTPSHTLAHNTANGQVETCGVNSMQGRTAAPSPTHTATTAPEGGRQVRGFFYLRVTCHAQWTRMVATQGTGEVVWRR